MSNFTVIHIEKRQELSVVLERHITRLQVQYVNGSRVESVWVPDNADIERTPMNREFISRAYIGKDGKKKERTLQQTINRRIEECGIKVRKGQARSLEMIFSGSPEVLCKLSDQQVNQWAEDTVSWAQNEWGLENVVSATLHMDESTPHIHLIVVPIVKGQSRRSASQAKSDQMQNKERKKYNIDQERLRLCANEVYTKPRLYHYHSSYAKEVGSKYGLQRGIMAEPGSVKRHLNSEEYNRKLAQEQKERKTMLEKLTGLSANAEAHLRQMIQQLKAEGQQMKIPQKKSFGLYKAADVDAFIKSATANLKLQHMQAIQPDYSKLKAAMERKLAVVRDQMDEYRKILSSPELMKQRIKFLESQHERNIVLRKLKKDLGYQPDLLSLTVENNRIKAEYKTKDNEKGSIEIDLSKSRPQNDKSIKV